MRSICKRIARGAAAAADKLERVRHSETLGRNTTYIDAPAAPIYPTQGRIQLTFESLPPIDNETHSAHADAQVRIFWQRLYIIPIVDVAIEVGVTWLELFILFHMRGGNAVAYDASSKRHVRDMHASSFRAFQSRSRALFQFASDDVKPPVETSFG